MDGNTTEEMKKRRKIKESRHNITYNNYLFNYYIYKDMRVEVPNYLKDGDTFKKIIKKEMKKNTRRRKGKRVLNHNYKKEEE